MVHDYGRTPAAIRRTIQYVRRLIKDPACVVVKVRDVIREYNRLVVVTGEQTFSYKSERSILDRIQPSLADNHIYLRTAPRRYGSYFCSMTKFDELSRPIPDSDAEYPQPVALYPLLRPLRDFILSCQEDILQGEWNRCDIIRHCPPQIWRYLVISLNHVQLLRRGRASARLNNSSEFKEWPLDPRACPHDLSKRPPYEFSFAVGVYHLIEHSFLFARSTQFEARLRFF